LKEIADTCGVAIVLIHHTRKDSKKDDWVNALMGSQGIAGAADAILYLNRERFAKKGVLYITGRTVKDNTINMSFDEGIWEVDRGASGKNSGRA
jgi:RecA-family ATPase